MGESLKDFTKHNEKNPLRSERVGATPFPFCQCSFPVSYILTESEGQSHRETHLSPPPVKQYALAIGRRTAAYFSIYRSICVSAKSTKSMSKDIEDDNFFK